MAPPLREACPEEDKPAAKGLWCCVRTWTQLARCFGYVSFIQYMALGLCES